MCQNGIKRSVMGVRKRDRIKLKMIKRKTKFEKVQTVYRKLKWRWAGHMTREKKEKLTKTITECTLEKEGKPQKEGKTVKAMGRRF
ncbi:hypothetical protein EVAR_84405_1 [Eumeta japonica]|uniref:Uncharacterized protein n=1 Tax=Eumeta variegata TaxID=151549 RepID=A0A4C1YGA9_EUMVA|nr:hypothetical protein EVAR_84405_1 [Eumeta japonica]